MITAVDLSGYDKLIDKIAKDLHSGKMKPSDLNQELISQTYEDLAKGAKAGYGKDWAKFPADGKGSTPTELKKNIYAFSGAKCYAQLEKINSYLYDKDGKLRPFNEFAVFARKENRQYNVNYLQAEYQTARTAAQMAEKWERLQETKDLFPNLEYRTVGDDRVRRDHQRLDGIIKPMDDPFWDRHYPPLDWRCRCDVRATAADATDDKDVILPPVKFKGNVGKDKEIFTNKGTFFRLISGDGNAKRNQELAKFNAPFEDLKTEKGKTVKISVYADRKAPQFDGDLEVATVLADVGVRTSLLAHVNIDKEVHPTLSVSGKPADRITPKGLGFKNDLSKANEQRRAVLVVDLKDNDNTMQEVVDQLRIELKDETTYPEIKEVVIVSADRKEVKQFSRKDFNE
ncbi:MAG: minor capsid protein [Flavobacterium sp.]|nr:minor capsid protein [Flavobacterium sp.]